MTKHPPNPKCECDHCFVDDLNAVLRRFIEQREARNADAELRSAYQLQPFARRFAEPRELGKPPVDPDAEQLAGDVVLEMARAG